MRITIRDVAQACGVGVTTVSRALNDQAGISPVTRERIVKMAHAMGYHPNVAAQRLRQSNSRTIAIIIKGPSNPFFMVLLERFEKKLRSEGYVVTIVRVLHTENEIEAACFAQSVSKLSGMIMLGGWVTAGKEGWSKVRVPSVLCTLPACNKEDFFSSVAVDDERAMREIVQHLAELGHSRIAFLGSERGDESVGHIRQLAFTKAMHEQGLNIDNDLIVQGLVQDFPYSFDYGYHMAADLISQRRDFTALVAMTDASAIGAMRALADARVRIPHDIAVTGIDGLDMGSFTTPRLTTIIQPIQALVEHTCKLLIARISGAANRHILLPGELHISESTLGISDGA